MGDPTLTCRRLIVADDHSVVRHGLVALFSKHPDLSVVGEAADGETAVRLAQELAPDVAVIDVRMPGMGGIEACRKIREVSPATQVVILTSFADEEALVGAMLAGARGYALKNLGDASLLEVIRAAARGEAALDPSVGDLVARGMQRLAAGDLRVAPGPRPAAPGGLSDLDRRLLRMIAEGHTNREIAEALSFTEKTIRNYVSTMLARLGLRNRAEAAAYAVSQNLQQ